ncbi:unnamed protein product [Symbiodinium sp. CCMP2592]|nr:unnamed protein product [Symbiodinium sp. CCMP2592]
MVGPRSAKACPPCPTRATPGLRGFPVLLGQKTWAPIERPIPVKIPGKVEKVVIRAVKKILDPSPAVATLPTPSTLGFVGSRNTLLQHSPSRLEAKRRRIERGYWGVD